jgi:3-phosphoinositide dependent protein kinase-1
MRDTRRLNLSVAAFELTRVLGEGSMSTVFQAQLKETGQVYALKVIDKLYIQRHKTTDAVIRERHIMDKLHSDLVVRLRFTFQDSQKLYMAMDLYKAGDLFEQLQLRKPLPLDDARFYAAEVVLILEYLRSQRVVFRDLKPENLLLTEAGHLAITDFGCAKILDHAADAAAHKEDPASEASATQAPDGSSDSAGESSAAVERRRVTFVGTADYLAPEILRNSGCSFAVDLWGLGCLLFQLIAGVPPFR